MKDKKNYPIIILTTTPKYSMFTSFNSTREQYHSFPAFIYYSGMDSFLKYKHKAVWSGRAEDGWEARLGKGGRLGGIEERERRQI